MNQIDPSFYSMSREYKLGFTDALKWTIDVVSSGHAILCSVEEEIMQGL